MTRTPDEPLVTYGRARDAVVTALAELRTQLARMAGWHDEQEDREQLERTLRRLRDGRFVLAVVGEFSSGKSFLLNALLGKVELEERMGAARIVGLLATDINPSTATITELQYATDERATAYYADGREERIPLGRLTRFVAVGEEAKLHDAVGDERGSPTLVRVAVDSAFLANGFVVADTPGLASINPAHRRATLSYLPGADAVLYLVDTQQPFSEGDASFLGIIRRYIESIFIVQTKIDLWRMRDGDRETWQSASARIVAQAAIHAPDVAVFPLSAREYAEGQLTGNPELVAQSRFLEFLAALDASLVATTGRSRLRRAAAEARRLATRAGDALAREAAALELDEATLRDQHRALLPALAAVDTAASAAQAELVAIGATLETTIVARGAEMRASLKRTLARAFDTADIARLRDRARLHIIVDDTVATEIGRFAADVAETIAQRMRAQARAAVGEVVSAGRSAAAGAELSAILDAIAAERLPLTEDAATAFGADPGSGAWSTDIETGLRSTIVLGALGGPAVGLVNAIAGRFSAAPAGAYMKRELIADLRAHLFEDFDREVAAYVALNARRIITIAGRLGERVAGLAQRVRVESLGSLDSALEVRERGADAVALAAAARDQAQRIAALATRIETVTETFARESRLARIEHADPLVPLDDSAGRQRVAPEVGKRFDPDTYEHGLRPERWRIAVLGALRRGKSSLVNAIAGERLLRDEGSDVEMRFPVHVRYGPVSRAYALGDDAAWDDIPFDSALAAATRTPVLIETPWPLPRQLVLVHTPAFDSGLPDAEQIVFAVASGASEMLALFSRQLSDRELDVYGRIAKLGKPMTFVHTLADNEESGERRNVVTLADRYLREHAILPQRIFTVSASEYRSAREAGRAPAAWNEMVALQSTLESRAQEHMDRLERAERERLRNERIATAAAPASPVRPPSLLDKLFGRR
ncbi:MAG: dynamin family protein [Candidatus Velthaea sp.]|jgi:predicted GTPase